LATEHLEEKVDTEVELSPFQKTLKEISDPFKALATSPRALWGLYIAYVLEGLVYFGILTILGKYCSENVGLTDLHAGWVYSGLTGGITLAMLFLGGVADRLGVRKALLISLSVMVIGRMFLGASGTFFEQGLGSGSAMFYVVICGLFLVVIGYGMFQPAAYAGVKQFTDEKTAAMGYAMIYGLMNLGAFFSGILSPRIRLNFGIVSVYWVYVLLTIVAFLTVLFVMTKKIIKRDTLTDISTKEEEKEGEEGDNTTTTKREPLLTPTFILFIAATLASLTVVVYLALTAAPAPGEASITQAASACNTAQKALLAEDAQGSDQEKTMLSVAESIEASALALAPPEPLPKNATLIEAIYPTAKIMLNSDAQTARSLADTPDAPIRGGSENALALRDQLRVFGIASMTGAYAITSEIDEKILDGLRSRMKDAGEEPIPLPDSERARILGMADADVAAICRELAQFSDDTVNGLPDTEPAALFKIILNRESRLLREIAPALEEYPSKQLENLVKERLLHVSVFLLKDSASILKSEDEARTKLLLASWLGATEEFDKTLMISTKTAVQIRTSQELKNWASRYALAIVAALIFAILFTTYLLRRRPDHPFNDGRFVFFIFILIPVQTLFAHNWLTLPYYIDRAFGGTAVGDNFEFFSNINPILIFFLAPMVAALTAKAKVYPMMIWGTLVMAAPTFLLVLTPSPATLLSYILLMSIGEAMWQPRFLQWVAEIAPEGQTGLYMGIGQFPWFLTKVLTGLYSGYFLARYCPVVGPQNTQMMWFIYSLIAMASPFALWLARGWMMKAKNLE